MSGAAIVLAWAVGCGGPAPSPAPAPASDPARSEEPAAGRWRQVDAARAEALEALGYVDGSRAPAGPDGARGRAPGWLLITSGHAPGASLLDPEGVERWRWSAGWAELFPELPAPADTAAGTSWRRARLLPGGDVVAVFEGLGRARIGPAGEVRWKVADGSHHDLDVVGAEAWGLVREARVRPEIDAREPVLDDALVRWELATGREVARCGLIDAIVAGGGRVGLSDRPGLPGDVLHTNSVEAVRAAWPGAAAVRPGQVLLSFLATSTVAVVDPVACRVVWSVTGPWKHQHDPHLLADGTLVVFDNEAGDARSRVVRWAPGEVRPRWTWGEELQPPLWSATCGAVEPLAEGWLVTESDGGRALWVGPDGAVRWAWGSPHRAGKKGRRVATLFSVEVVKAPAFAAR